MLYFDNIRAIAIDVDGTLTDGIYTVSDQGVYSKSFHTKDFWAIEKALKNGIYVIIITQAHDKVIQCRINNICEGSRFWKESIETHNLKVLTGVNNKVEALKSLESIYQINISSHLAFIGDADNDLPAMREAYFAACPQDAWDNVKMESNYVSSCNGGRGAVFDIINYILEKKGDPQ